jgi:hypothetical protein
MNQALQPSPAMPARPQQPRGLVTDPQALAAEIVKSGRRAAASAKEQPPPADPLAASIVRVGRRAMEGEGTSDGACSG